MNVSIVAIAFVIAGVLGVLGHGLYAWITVLVAGLLMILGV